MPGRIISSIIKNQKLVTVPPNATVTAAAKLMQETRIGALLVVEGNALAGIFTERDALFRVLAAGRDPERTQIGDVMTANPQTVESSRPLGHALYMMHEGGYRHVPVVEGGKPVGMVSARDALGPELKEFQNRMDDLAHLSEVIG